MKTAALLASTLTAFVAMSCTVSSQRTSAPLCHRHGDGIFSAADRACTAGKWIDSRPSRETVCSKSYNPRPPASVTRPIKLAALLAYGDPRAAASTFELDHDFPRWLGGATTLVNLWPEPNYPANQQTRYVHNPKDRLEFAVYSKVCKAHSLTVDQARAIFAGDWRVAYRKYVTP